MIKEQYLAGFLQKRLIKEVQVEDWKEWAKTPNQPLPKFVAKKDKKNLLWWIIFSKNLVKELAP
jgi:hypothetical protein